MYHVVSLVGPPGHGKTSLLQEPTEYYMASMEVRKHVVERSSNMFLEVWDTPGLHRFAAARDHCLRRCDAHLLVVRSGEDVDVSWDELVDKTPGLWAMLIVRGPLTDALLHFSTRKKIQYYVVGDSDDAWSAVEDLLKDMLPRVKTIV